jgi:hypothetical protein
VVPVLDGAREPKEDVERRITGGGARSGRSGRRVAGWLRAVLGLVVSLGVLAVVEGVLRLTIPLDDLLYRWERAGSLEAVVDGMRRMRAGEATFQDGPYEWSVTVDSAGFRARASALAAHQSIRVLALGDSWVFGVSVDQDATIPVRLEQALNTDPRAGGRTWEVLNAGLPGACAYDMRTLWRRLVAEVEPDVVLLGRPHNEPRQDWFDGERRAGATSIRSAPVSTLRIYLVLRRLLYLGRAPEVPTVLGEEPLVEDLMWILDDAKTRGIEGWVLEFPDNWEHRSEFRPRIGDEAAARGAIVASHALEERGCWGYRDRTHPGELGAEAIAKVLSESVLSNQSLRLQSNPTCESLRSGNPGLPPHPTRAEDVAAASDSLPPTW